MARRIAFLIFDGFQILDAAGPIAAFEIAGRYCEGAYALEVIAAERGLTSSSSSAAIAASAFRPRASYDTLVVAGGDGTRAAFQEKTPVLCDDVNNDPLRPKLAGCIPTSDFNPGEGEM